MLPFEDALGGLLREHQGMRMGRISFRAFAKEVGGWDESTLRKMVQGKITLQPEAVEAMAERLGAEPEYFREYRIWQIERVLDLHPDVEGLVYDIAMDVAEKRDGKRPHAGKGK